MKVVILAAGMGSRLGMTAPKCLTELNNGESILGRQVKALGRFKNEIFVVVGYKMDLIMEAFPELFYVYNPRFDTTNTSKSLLSALSKFKDEDVLWLNGDVVFDPDIIEYVLQEPHSFIAVNTAAVGEEEVKYNVNQDGFICEISKRVDDALGEAVGINLVRSQDLENLKQALERCDDQDYFERAVELAIGNGSKFRPVDVSSFSCVEVDFKEDLERAQSIVQSTD